MGDVASRESFVSSILDAPAAPADFREENGAETSRKEPIENGILLPPMVLIVNTVMFSGASHPGKTPDGEKAFCSVFLNSKEVGRSVSYPSQPLKLKSCTTASELVLKCFSASNAETFLRKDAKTLHAQRVGAEVGQDEEQSVIRLMAEVSLPLSMLVKYGAPLFTSLWLGLDINEESSEAQGFTDALTSSCKPDVPKVHITIFRPDENKSPRRRVNLPGNSFAVLPLEPDLQALFQQENDFDFCVSHSSNISATSQLKGLVEALKLSNKVAYCWQDAINTSPSLAQQLTNDAKAELEDVVNKNKELQKEVDNLRIALESSDAQRKQDRLLRDQERALRRSADSDNMAHAQEVTMLKDKLVGSQEALECARKRPSPQLLSELRAEVDRLQQSLCESDVSLAAEQERASTLALQLQDHEAGSQEALERARQRPSPRVIPALQAEIERLQQSLCESDMKLAVEQERACRFGEQLREFESAELAIVHERKRPSSELVSELSGKLHAEEEESCRLREELNERLTSSDELEKQKIALWLAKSNLDLEKELSSQQEDSKRSLIAGGAQRQLQVEGLQNESLQPSDAREVQLLHELEDVRSAHEVVKAQVDAERKYSASLHEHIDYMREQSCGLREQLNQILTSSNEQMPTAAAFRIMLEELTAALDSNIIRDSELSAQHEQSKRASTASGAEPQFGVPPAVHHAAELEKALEASSELVFEFNTKLSAEQEKSGRLRELLDELLSSRGGRVNTNGEYEIELQKLKADLQSAECTRSDVEALQTSVHETNTKLTAEQEEVCRLRDQLHEVESAESAVVHERKKPSAELISDLKVELADEQEQSCRLREQLNHLVLSGCGGQMSPSGQSHTELGEMKAALQLAESNLILEKELSADREQSKRALTACGAELQLEVTELRAAHQSAESKINSVQGTSLNLQRELDCCLQEAGNEEAQLREQLERMSCAQKDVELQVSAEREISAALREQIKEMLVDAQDTAISLHSQMHNTSSSGSEEIHEPQIEAAPEEIFRLRDAHKRILASCAEKASMSRFELQAEIVRLQAALASLQIETKSPTSSLRNLRSESKSGKSSPRGVVSFMTPRTSMEMEMNNLSNVKTELQAELGTVRSALEDAELRVAGGAAVEHELKAQLEQLRSMSVTEEQCNADARSAEQQRLQSELDELRRSHADTMVENLEMLRAQKSMESNSTTSVQLHSQLEELRRNHEELKVAEARELEISEANVYAERAQCKALLEQVHAASPPGLLKRVEELQDALGALQLRAETEQREAARLREYADTVIESEHRECERFIEGTRTFHELQAQTEHLQKELKIAFAKQSGRTNSENADSCILRLFWRLMCEKYSHLSAEDLLHVFSANSNFVGSEVERALNKYKAQQRLFSVEQAFQKLDVVGSGRLPLRDFEERVEQGFLLDTELSGYIYRVMLSHSKSNDGVISKDAFTRLFSQFNNDEVMDKGGTAEHQPGRVAAIRKLLEGSVSSSSQATVPQTTRDLRSANVDRVSLSQTVSTVVTLDSPAPPMSVELPVDTRTEPGSCASTPMSSTPLSPQRVLPASRGSLGRNHYATVADARPMASTLTMGNARGAQVADARPMASAPTMSNARKAQVADVRPLASTVTPPAVRRHISDGRVIIGNTRGTVPVQSHLGNPIQGRRSLPPTFGVQAHFPWPPPPGT